jgi:hypothetical protein
MTPNTKYKDSVFCMLFNDEAKLRRLYNTLTGASYGEETPVAITTLKDVLFMQWKNDISFTIGNKMVVLIEHVRYEVTRLAA